MKIKNRHKLWFKIAGPIMNIYLKKKFNYTYEKCDIKPPFLVLCNHTIDFDPFIIARSFSCPIYFVMSDHVSSLKAGKLIKHLVSPIPITKSSIDAETVKNIFDCVNQGAAVGLFPEGNKSFAGEMSLMKPSIAKLAKKLNVPVLIYNVEGGYFSSPRWSKIKRKGHVHGFVKRIITPDEIKELSTEQLFEEIKNSLNVNAYEIQEQNKVKFLAKDKAENIQALLYSCPNCGAWSTIYGKGDEVLCSVCDLHGHYNDFGYLDNINNCKFDRLDVWDKWQKDNINNYDFTSLSDDDAIFTDENWEIQLKINKYKSNSLGIFKSILTKSNLILFNDNDKIAIDLKDIVGTAIEGTCGIQLWLKSGAVYRMKNGLNINALKYVNFIHYLNGKPFNF